jgi:hypothetical protein
MNPGIEAVRKLALLGYRFTVNGETIKAKYKGQGNLDPIQIRPLLALVKEHKEEVIDYLDRSPHPLAQRHVTCFECARFRRAVKSPNASQAWGYCEKRRRGRFGVATACEALLVLHPDLGELRH